MGAGGFEPPKALPADLQSAPFVHLGTRPNCLIQSRASERECSIYLGPRQVLGGLIASIRPSHTTVWAINHQTEI